MQNRIGKRPVKVRLAVYDRIDPGTPLEFTGRVYELGRDDVLMQEVVRRIASRNPYHDLAVGPFVVRDRS